MKKGPILKIVLLLAAGVGMGFAGENKFQASLSGKDTKASGMASFELKDGALEYDLAVKDIKDITGSHIHTGKPGMEGPPVVNLPVGKGKLTDKDFMGPMKGKTVADLAAEIKAGNTYVNVHTKTHPGGEIRGQIK